VIGVYEPLVVVDDGEAREGSRAAEPELCAERAEHHHRSYYHRSCYMEHGQS